MEKPIAHGPSEWHSRLRIPDWSLVWPLMGGLGCLNLTRHFSKFNSSSSAHGCRMNLSCKKRWEQLKRHQTGTSLIFQDRLYGHQGGLLATNVCMRVRIWSDICFYYNMLPDSEVVGKETYCPHFLVTTEAIQKHPQVCDPRICSGQLR